MKTVLLQEKPASDVAVASRQHGSRSLPAVPVLQQKAVDAEKKISIQEIQPAVDSILTQRKVGIEEEFPAQAKFVLQKASLPNEELLQKKNIEEELQVQGKFVSQRLALLEEEPVQKKGIEDELPVQAKFIAQKVSLTEDEPLQGKFGSAGPVAQLKSNNTGLPDNLKAGIESLGGYDMNDVKVHYNSPQPAQLHAHAYAQGTDIHIGPGQEKHLPHEAWHVVQQKQGRVRPTMQMKGGVPVNDDAGLEQEADVMGAKAIVSTSVPARYQQTSLASSNPLQFKVPGAGFKEQAQTGSYQARGGKTDIYHSSRYPRSGFSFGSNTRYEVLGRYNPVYAGNRIISVQAHNGQQVNVEGVQLDHQKSWDNISKEMDNHNSQTLFKSPENCYTLWDAKMYYNDQENLMPALGNLNASAGARGVGKADEIHPGLQPYLGNISMAWMNLQAGITSVGTSISDGAAQEIATLLTNISVAMNEATEKLF